MDLLVHDYPPISSFRRRTRPMRALGVPGVEPGLEVDDGFLSTEVSIQVRIRTALEEAVQDFGLLGCRDTRRGQGLCAQAAGRMRFVMRRCDRRRWCHRDISHLLLQCALDSRQVQRRYLHRWTEGMTCRPCRSRRRGYGLRCRGLPRP